MNNETNNRRHNTRTIMKKSLLSLISEKSFDSITIKDISIRSGYNRNTFYLYFQDKYELLDIIIEEVLDGLNQVISSTEKIELGTNIDVHPDILKLFEYVYNSFDFFKLMLGDKRVSGFIPTFLQSLLHMYEDIIAVYPNKKKVERNLYLSYITGATFGVISFWVTERNSYSPLFVAKQLTQIVIQRPQKVLFNTTTNKWMEESPSKIDKRIIRTKADLKRSFLQLSIKKDFNNITITDICYYANYSRNTFYNHYIDITDLAFDLMKDKMNDLMNGLNVFNEEDFNHYKTNKSIAFLFNYIYKQKTFFTIVLSERKIPNSLSFIRNYFREFYQFRIKRITHNFPSLDWDIYIAYITSATLAIIIHWIDDDLKDSPTHIAEQFTYILGSSPK